MYQALLAIIGTAALTSAAPVPTYYDECPCGFTWGLEFCRNADTGRDVPQCAIVDGCFRVPLNVCLYVTTLKSGVPITAYVFLTPLSSILPN